MSAVRLDVADGIAITAVVGPDAGSERFGEREKERSGEIGRLVNKFFEFRRGDFQQGAVDHGNHVGGARALIEQ